MRSLATQLLALFALASMLSTHMMSKHPVTVDDEALSDVRGGSIHYCVGSAISPASQQCNVCLPNGNNQYVKCDDPANDMTWQWAAGQSPAQMWDDAEVPCTFGAKRFSDGGGLNEVKPSMGRCYRTYTTMTFVGYANGVYCGGP